MPAPVFAGTDRALVRLDSGEYICVDTNSIDSIPYLLGQPVERHAVRCFLRPEAVVLDVGANFGLYTAIAAAVVRGRGQVYAFEGNPHTFDLLMRTLQANRVLITRASRRSVASSLTGVGGEPFITRTTGSAARQ
jgi:tRNA G37 N-methylase Trm5